MAGYTWIITTIQIRITSRKKLTDAKTRQATMAFTGSSAQSLDNNSDYRQTHGLPLAVHQWSLFILHSLFFTKADLGF